MLPVKALIRQLGVTLPFRLSRSFCADCFCLSAINFLIEWCSIMSILDAARRLLDPDQGCISVQAMEAAQSLALVDLSV